MEGEIEGAQADTAAPHQTMQTPAQALDAWLDQHIRNSAVSRDTAAWNRITRSVGDIKAAIAAVQEV